MLQGIKASALTMPTFSHHLSTTGGSKMNYNDLDPWHWSQQPPPPSAATSQNCQNIFDPSMYSSFGQHTIHPRQPLPPAANTPAPLVTEHNPPTPPPQRHHASGGLVKAQPPFKPTWHGFLDSTKDAMTIVEAALQGRLSHISRRPHDKERADMLVSGTVLVYEENASGIKRWTDAVHWSPSRVMNNCLIYRQLVRALKPEEKKAALNPSCGGKRKRKEGGNVNQAEDEYTENAIFEGGIPGDATPNTDHPQSEKVYANFAQNLTPEQQRRFCGSLVDSYEFKEGGLMKKTISVKFKGTHHHVISYYSLEDVVSGKLKRPCEDPNLAGIAPREELLRGWKVSLEDEESKDLPLIPSYAQQTPVSRSQHHAVPAKMPQAIDPLSEQLHTAAQGHPPLPVQATNSATDYWHGNQTQQYSSQPHATQQYVQQTPTSYMYAPQHSTPSYTLQAYPQNQSVSQQYPLAPASTPGYAQGDTRSYEPVHTPTEQYPQQQYTPTLQHHYTVPQMQYFDLPIHGVPNSVHHHEPRRASAPVKLETNIDPVPTFPTHSPTYYRNDQSQPYTTGSQNYGF